MSPDRINQAMELIIKVRSGAMTAAAAAQVLGISRKTYYKLEERALRGMQSALADRKVGRPGQPVDLEKEKMRAEIDMLRLQQVRWDQVQKIRQELGLMPGKSSAKKKGSVDPVAQRDRPGADDRRMFISGGQQRAGTAARERQAVASAPATGAGTVPDTGAQESSAPGHGGGASGREKSGARPDADCGDRPTLSALSERHIAPGVGRIDQSDSSRTPPGGESAATPGRMASTGVDLVNG